LKLSLHSIRTMLLAMFFIPLLLFVIEAVYLLGAAAQLMLGADRDLYQALTAYMTLTMRSLDFESRQAYLASHEENIRQTKEQIARARQLIGEAGILDMKHERSGKSVEELNEADNGLVSWETATKKRIWSKGLRKTGKKRTLRSN